MNREAEIHFHELADLSPDQRESYFQERQVPADVRAEVEALLRFDGNGESLTECVAASAERVLQTEVGIGRRCGSYRLVRLLGRGGMGSVYLAERADGEVEQRAAIKFLRYGGEEPAFVDRFLRERRILAALNHPGIARLLDVGRTADGQPYLAMDYIEGAPIDVYAAKLDITKKLALFIQVCEAVSYAHQHLVIHRDIKPSNILVDAAGQAKLLDFGIAKLLQDEEHGGAATLLTRDAGVALTPEYAAPEQVTGGPVTTAIDVYALGVLLYVLLAGEHPAGPGPHSSAALLKAVVDTDAPRMSNAAGAASKTPLRGDLDTIAAKALKKNPRERYVSTAALADDVRHYLRSEPILARPDTLAYRSAKFVRRNRVSVALVSLTLTAALAGAVGTLMQARTARQQRDFALRQLSRAESINDLNAFLLSDAAPSGQPFTVDSLLERAEHVIERQRGDPASRLELLISIGRQYTVQDEYFKARRLLQEAYTQSAALPNRSIHATASCALAQTLSRAGDLARSETLFQEGLKALPDQQLYALDRIFCLERGSEIASNRGFPQEAITRAQSAQRLLLQAPIRSELEELNLLVRLASSYKDAGQHREASAAFEQAWARLASLGRDDTQRAATVLNNWGSDLILAGRPLDAGKVFRRAIDVSRDNAIEQTVSPVLLVNYARSLHDVGRFEEAASYAERGYVKAQAMGDNVPIIQALILRAAIYRSRGDLQRAAGMLSEVEPRLRQGFAPGHLAFASLALQQALLAKARGDLLTALEGANQAVAITENLIKSGRHGADFLPNFLVGRSDIELELGRPDQAAADAARALNMLQETAEPGTFSGHMGHAYLMLGRARQAQGKPSEAGAALRSAAEHLQNALGADHPDTRRAGQLREAAAPHR